MNKYRFSGTIPEFGLVQIDVEAKNVSEAKNYLVKNYDDFETIVVSKI